MTTGLAYGITIFFALFTLLLCFERAADEDGVDRLRVRDLEGFWLILVILWACWVSYLADMTP